MSRRRVLQAALAAAAAPLLVSAQRSKRQPRKPDIEIVRISSVRQEGRIAYEGSYRVAGDSPVSGLVIHFSFFESRGGLLSMQKIDLEEDTLPPGEERRFDLQGRDVPRAVRFTISATDRRGRDLLVSGVGPYPLD